MTPPTAGRQLTDTHWTGQLSIPPFIMRPLLVGRSRCPGVTTVWQKHTRLAIVNMPQGRIPHQRSIPGVQPGGRHPANARTGPPSAQSGCANYTTPRRATGAPSSGAALPTCVLSVDAAHTQRRSATAAADKGANSVVLIANGKRTILPIVTVELTGLGSRRDHELAGCVHILLFHLSHEKYKLFSISPP